MTRVGAGRGRPPVLLYGYNVRKTGKILLPGTFFWCFTFKNLDKMESKGLNSHVK